MSDSKFQNTYRIPSARYKEHAYDGGMYFITICTAERQHYLGKIDDNSQIKLSEIGQCVTEQIVKTKELRKDIGAEIPVYVVMPNHIHLIVCIEGQPHRDVDENPTNRFGPQRKNLSSIIRGIKASVTHFANQNNIPFAWQSRFHDRIIRDFNELNSIVDYIENNPYNWKNDEFY